MSNVTANEIGCAVLRYIEMLIQKAGVDEIDIIFYSDNCSGQQKNKYLLSLYAYAVAKYPTVRSVTHKYLIIGHTQNEGDNVHSVIEKQVKRYIKANAIYVSDK